MEKKRVRLVLVLLISLILGIVIYIYYSKEITFHKDHKDSQLSPSFGFDLSKIDPSLVNLVLLEMKKYPTEVVDLALTKLCLKAQADLIARNTNIDPVTAKFASLPTCSCTTFSLKTEPQYEEINRKAIAGMDYLKILQKHEDLLPKLDHCAKRVKFEDVCARDLLSLLPLQDRDSDKVAKFKSNCTCAIESFLKSDNSLALDFMFQTLKEDSFLKAFADPRYQKEYTEASEGCEQ
jgi:hypothetical protein